MVNRDVARSYLGVAAEHRRTTSAVATRLTCASAVQAVAAGRPGRAARPFRFAPRKLIALAPTSPDPPIVTATCPAEVTEDRAVRIAVYAAPYGEALTGVTRTPLIDARLEVRPGLGQDTAIVLIVPVAGEPR